jgi:hypothetical protein
LYNTVSGKGLGCFYSVTVNFLNNYISPTINYSL